MRVGAWGPEISHAIPLRMFQLLKSERWNSAVFRVGHRAALRELHAKLVRPTLLTPLCVRRRWAYAACLAASLVVPVLRAWPRAPSCLRYVPGLACLVARLHLVRRECCAYFAACSASRAAASRAAFLARACASTSSGVRGPCVEPSLPSVRSHEMARLSRAPKRAR